uniref:Uncharacterized protein n=1 Tax=Acrobeloides nanus TaxID=290746 RepID=A0A914C3B8_9BILA
MLFLLPILFILTYSFEENAEIQKNESESVDTFPLLTLTQDILNPKRYDPRVRPSRNVSVPLKIHVTMSLYQIIQVNEPMQNIKMNVWMIQKWTDELLDWNPNDYGMINTTILLHSAVWLPDTYVYNSVVMNADEMERYMNIRADSLYWEGKKGANISFLYPAIYTINCKFNIAFFPYDQQNCTITMSSWTSDSSSLDYYANEDVNLQSYIANEEWSVVSFKIYRHEYLYACCPKPWVILEASLILRRKPLYYVLNLLVPTSIITVVAIFGFFTPASTGDDRTEKFNLGITTLLAMSILLLMVSDQMPTTSEFVPLIAWYYLTIIIIIALGTLLTSRVAHILRVPIPSQLQLLWDELRDDPMKIYNKKNYELKKVVNEEPTSVSPKMLKDSLKSIEIEYVC